MRKKLFYIILLILWVLCLTAVDSGADVLVAEAKIHGAVEAYVRKVLVDFPGDIQVLVRHRGDLRIGGTGAVKLQVRPSQERSQARSIPVMLEVRRGSVLVREYPLTAQVRYFDNVLVAGRPLLRGEPLEGDAVNVERREVTTMLGRYLTDVSELKGRQARMRIGFGRLIQERYTERIPVVNRGETVRIRVDVGGVSATAVGVARATGAVGDHIVVQNTTSREKLLAEVVGPGLVRVVF